MAGPILRLFFALPLPPELQAALGLWQDRQELPARWCVPQGLHLTLAFLGERNAAALPGLEACAAAVAGRHGAFELLTTTLGGFPSSSAARVLWLGLAPHPALQALAEDLRASLAAVGEVFDPKPFRPHLTLGRFPRGHHLTTAPPTATTFRAESLVLFESRPGGHYLPLKTWALRQV